MVKRRVIKTNKPTSEQIEQFAAGADGATVKPPALNPHAKRDYKAILLPFNQYEFEQLAAACNLSGRSKLNFVRTAMLKVAAEINEAGHE
jgi:hypothetical protein